jgi:hypothetical protein
MDNVSHILREFRKLVSFYLGDSSDFEGFLQIIFPWQPLKQLFTERISIVV